MGDAAKQQLAEPSAQQEWFTTREACAYTRVPLRTFKRALATGSLKPDSRARPGLGVHRFRRATLDAWLTGETIDGGQR